MVYKICVKEYSSFCSEIGKTKWKFSSQTLSNNNDNDNSTNNNYEIFCHQIKPEKEPRVHSQMRSLLYGAYILMGKRKSKNVTD